MEEEEREREREKVRGRRGFSSIPSPKFGEIPSSFPPN
jgi:hypothetical protein